MVGLHVRSWSCDLLFVFRELPRPVFSQKTRSSEEPPVGPRPELLVL
jgi:hypothetical protein